jgi:ribosome biogenesis GTPase A
MPGVLWPKFDDTVIGENLAATGAIKDAILDTESLAGVLCSRLVRIAPELFCTRYKLGDPAPLLEKKPYELLELVGRKRGFLISGGEVDTERAANILLEEFRGGKIGRITLDVPPKTDEVNHADACI